MTRSVFSDAYRHMCARLTEERQARGLTQAELAYALGRPQSYVAKYEAGERRLDVVEVLEIMAVMGLDPAAFVTELATQTHQWGRWSRLARQRTQWSADPRCAPTSG